MTDDFKLNYKIDGDILDGSDVRENISMALTQVMMVSEDASRTLDDDQRYFTNDYSSIVDTGNTTCFYKNDVAFCDAMDYFLTGSVDGDIWSSTTGDSASVTETGGYLRLYINYSSGSGGSSSVTATADQTNALDLKATDCEVVINMESDNSASFVLYDSSANEVSLTGPATLTRSTYRIVINNSTTTAYVYTSLEDTTPAVVDISSLVGTNIWLKFKMETGAVFSTWTGTMKIHSIGYLDGTAGSSAYQSASQTISSSSAICSRYVASSGIIVQLSTDAGSNYTTITTNTLVGTTAGTGLIVKSSATHETTLDVSATGRNIEYIMGDFQAIY